MVTIVVNKRIIVFVLLLLLIASCKKDEKKFIGVVSSATPEASIVGEKIFLKGGNAIDVAVAVSFALGVTEPAMSGLGGGTQIILSLKNEVPISINGTTLSPRTTPINVKDTLSYHRRSTIPSTVKVLDHIWRKYGSGKISWEELLGPAIELAENGFSVGKFRAKVYQKYSEKLLASNHNTSFFLNANNQIPNEGDNVKQPILAKTLRRLAKFGADDFYNGKIAEEIANDMKINGGWISLNDLQNFPDPKELMPLSIEYKNNTIYAQPPPCGGWVTLLAINLIKDESANNNISNEAIIKALYLAHTDRRKNPITDLTDYDSIIKVKLSDSYSKMLSGNDIYEANNENKSGETTHFSVADSDGTVIGVTSSINAYFGALTASKHLGFLYNTYMDDFIFGNPEHPFAIQPNAMAYSSMSPTIVQNNGENVLVIGSPGSSRIISTVAQVTAKWITNKNIVNLINMPRIHLSNNKIYLENQKDTAFIHQSLLDEYDLNYKFPDESLMINKPLNPYYGGVHAIAKENNTWIGAADPRRDGKVIKVIR